MFKGPANACEAYVHMCARLRCEFLRLATLILLHEQSHVTVTAFAMIRSTRDRGTIEALIISHFRVPRLIILAPRNPPAACCSRDFPLHPSNYSSRTSSCSVLARQRLTCNCTCICPVDVRRENSIANSNSNIRIQRRSTPTTKPFIIFALCLSVL